MILEAGQMGCDAQGRGWLVSFGKTRKALRVMRARKEYLRVNVPQDKQPPWGLTHVNHPCTIWTRQSAENYGWHMELMRCLLREYNLRYDKIHKSTEVYYWLMKNGPVSFPVKGRTPFPICMKEEYKVGDDPIQSYRKYYIKDKVRFAKWEPRAKTPDWFLQGVNGGN